MTEFRYIIRELEKKDNPYIQRIIQESLEKFGLDVPGTAYFDPQLSSLYEYYIGLPVGCYWVAVDKISDEVVGGIGLGPFGDYKNLLELQKYYLKDGYQNQGIGRMLFNEAFNYANELDMQKIYLETTDKLEQANAVYEHYGFKLLDRPLDGSEHGLMNRWYVLNLANTSE